MHLRKSCLSFHRVIISFIGVLLLATSFTATAVEVEMESRPINLQNSLMKWFLILNSKPSALSPKLTLATVAEEDMGDYAYLLEVNRELRRDKNFDSIPVELAVITSPEQKQRFYKYFQETSDLNIHWMLDEESEDQYADQELNNSSLVYFLSFWPELNGPITPNWLNITHYTSLPDWDESLYDYVMSLGQQAEDYYQTANISTQSSTCLRRREGEEESEIIDWELLTEQLDSHEFSCDLYQSQENCLNPITFGLSEKTVGLPFNSLLSEKVNEFEQSPDKNETRMARDFNALLKEKPWLGEALSGKKPAFNPFEAIRQSPYYIAYYHGQAFLKEYLAIISQIDDSIPTIVLNISLEQLKSSAYHGMFADLGYGKVTFQSETETVSYPIPEALSYKQIKIVNPGPIASQDAYNALIYFSHPLILVAGNLSLAKVISMHKVPLYEWRSFQTDVNKDLKAFWQGTALEAFFENRYAPQEKSEALKALNFNPLVLREVSQRIMRKHNIIPTLLDIIWLTHQPSHPLWQWDQDAREIMAMPSSRELLSEIQAVRDLTKREILAGKIILNYTQTAQPILSSYELGALFSLVEDPVIKAYLKSLLEKR